jgi:hypothetical protein
MVLGAQVAKPVCPPFGGQETGCGVPKKIWRKYQQSIEKECL